MVDESGEDESDPLLVSDEVKSSATDNMQYVRKRDGAQGKNNLI